MADYQDIRGLRVKYLSADPTVTVAGQVWYNSTTGTLRSQLISEAWSSGAPMSTARGSAGSGGIQTAAWVAGGTLTPASGSEFAITEEFNGSGWSSGGDLTNPRGYSGGSGPITAGLVVGGYHPPPSPNGETFVEEYDGSTWTAGTATPVGLWVPSVFGTQTAAVSAGQEPGTVSAVFNYDGSTWTTGGTMNSTRGYTTSAGTQTAGWIAGGAPAPTQTLHELYDGSAWTVSPALTSTGSHVGGANGPQTSAIYFGGSRAPAYTSVANTELFDGSSWTASAALGTAVDEMGSANNGTSNSTALSAGGLTNGAAPALDITQEFNKSTNVITAGAWASGNNMNQTRRGIASASAGTQTAALGAMGYTSPPGGVGRSDAETYDGSTWTAITAMPVTRYFGGGFGTQGAAVIVGGYSTVPTASQKNETYEWNGSSWSQTGNQAAGISNFAGPGVGIESAGMIAGGSPAPTNWQLTQEYNGSAWASSPGSLNTGRTSGGVAGTQIAAIATAGDVGGPTPVTLASEEYDGSTWTSTANSLYDMYGVASAGTTSAALMACQDTLPPYAANAQGWDGSAWSTSPSFNTARQQMGGAGTATAAVAFSGNVMPGSTTTSAATEEFTGPTSAANIVTLTTS